MPTVPRSNVVPLKGEMPVPSETDLMMALAVMKQRGILERLDPNLQGQIEDRRGEPPSGAADEELPGIAADIQTHAAQRMRRAVRRQGPVLSAFDEMKRKRQAENGR